MSKQYQLIKRLYDNIAEEFEFRTKLDLKEEAQKNGGNLHLIRGLVESLEGGSCCFLTEGRLTLSNVNGKTVVNLQNTFEGWKYVDH